MESDFLSFAWQIDAGLNGILHPETVESRGPEQPQDQTVALSLDSDFLHSHAYNINAESA